MKERAREINMYVCMYQARCNSYTHTSSTYTEKGRKMKKAMIKKISLAIFYEYIL